MSDNKKFPNITVRYGSPFPSDPVVVYMAQFPSEGVPDTYTTTIVTSDSFLTLDYMKNKIDEILKRLDKIEEKMNNKKKVKINRRKK